MRADEGPLWGPIQRVLKGQVEGCPSTWPCPLKPRSRPEGGLAARTNECAGSLGLCPGGRGYGVPPEARAKLVRNQAWLD